MYKNLTNSLKKPKGVKIRSALPTGKLFPVLMFVNMVLVIAGYSQTTGNRKALLTDGASKDWYLYASTPESAGATCQASHAISLDNTYTFFANGTFEFDCGTVTEDAGCEGNDCCSDFANAVGIWEFTNNNTGLRVTLLHEKGKTEILKLVIFDAVVVQLDKDSLRIAQTDPTTKTKYSIEFRRR